MQWNAGNIDELHVKAQNANVGIVLGFNEPEIPDQSNMTPEVAAGEWVRCIEPLRRAGYRCGSPGMSNAPQAIPWLQEFLRRIRQMGSDVDFWAIHWYGE